ncbi:cysteine desulfurase-like protein [Klebsiella sp. F-Nf9]|nr:cysteine desulfurase-like protein [Klebsiella sp. F-Nf9]PKJ69905.1 cysteine desulfurase-like protein [Klebsiella sp. X1-16S-Nf21]
MPYVRSNFPALDSPWVYLDNAGGTQVLKGVVDKLTDYLYNHNVQLGGTYEISQLATAAVAQGRASIQSLVGADYPEEIIFGSSSTVLLRNLAEAMKTSFRPGDEIIVTNLDHESNIGPWLALEKRGVKVRFWSVSEESLTLDIDDLRALVNRYTKLVCVTHASNVLGSVMPLDDIVSIVKSVGAKVCVDGVAFAPHRLVDVKAFDVDFYVFSLYKVFGLHGAVLYGRRDLLLELDSINHYFYGKSDLPAKLEPGNLNYEIASSSSEIVNYLVGLGRRSGSYFSVRESLGAAFAIMARHESELCDLLLRYLSSRSDCFVIGKALLNDEKRLPIISFKLEGINSADFCRAVDASKIGIRCGDFHASRLCEALRVHEHGGAVRVSLAHYNTVADVEALIKACECVAPVRLG